MDRFKLMHTFVAVVSHGSFSRAARELGVTRALVSKRIQNLEALLKVKLLNRDTHRIGITSAGRQYYESARILLDDLQRLEDGLASTREAPIGRITVLSSKTFGETILAPLVASFSSRYSDVAIDITLKDMPDHSSALLSGGYDLALCSLPGNDTQLAARKLLSIPRVLVASPEYLARAGTPRVPGELRHHNCLDPCGAPQYDWRFSRRSQVVAQVSGSPRANSSAVICHAALGGLGVALLRRYLVDPYLARGALVEVLGDYRVDDSNVYVLFQRDRYLPLRVKLFIDFLGENVHSVLTRASHTHRPRPRAPRIARN